MDTNGKINSEIEYWIEHDKFKSNLKAEMKKLKDSHYFNKFAANELLEHAEAIGLFSKEDITKWKKQLKL